MTAHVDTFTRARAVVAAAAVLTALAALCAMPASAAFPPAAAGKTIHGFLIKSGTFAPIDHPKAPSAPMSPDASAGTSTVGNNDRGEILGAYGDTSRIGKDLLFVRDRKGRFTRIADPFPRDSLTELFDINNRGEMMGVSYATQADLDRGVSFGIGLDRRGRITRIDVPGAALTAPFRSNERGGTRASCTSGACSRRSTARTPRSPAVSTSTTVARSSVTVAPRRARSARPWGRWP